jgi:hypothetical protein
MLSDFLNYLYIWLLWISWALSVWLPKGEKKQCWPFKFIKVTLSWEDCKTCCPLLCQSPAMCNPSQQLAPSIKMSGGWSSFCPLWLHQAVKTTPEAQVWLSAEGLEDGRWPLPPLQATLVELSKYLPLTTSPGRLQIAFLHDVTLNVPGAWWCFRVLFAHFTWKMSVLVFWWFY